MATNMRRSIRALLISVFMLGIAFGQTDLINESFGTVPPSGWTNGTTAPTQGTSAQDGDSKSLMFQENKTSAVSIVTFSVTDPDRVTFYHRASNASYVGTFNLYSGPSSSGPWTSEASITSSNIFTQSVNELGLGSGTYYFKLERAANSSNKRDLFIDVFQVTQSIVPGTSSLSGFNYEPDNGPSAEQSFTVSGADLTANIILNAPTNYEISTTSGSGFGSSLTLTQSGGTVASTTIYVRLKSGLSAGSYNSENITISSTGKISKTVACSGDVRQSINPSTATLSGFNYEPDNGPSAEQSFTVSGQDLTANIVLNAPTNYEISTTSGSGFGSSLTLTQNAGTVASTTIYVRLKSGLSAGAYNGENVTISSTGKISKTVACSGDVRQSINPSTALLSGFSYEWDNGPSSEQSFTVSGQDLSANITLTPPTNYEISTTSGSGFGSSLTLTQSGGAVASTTIYVRLKAGLSESTYNGENVTISSTGKISRTVTCNGFVGPMILNVKVFLQGGL